MKRNARVTRAGTLMICVLVCLLVASAIAAASTQLALQSRRAIRVDQQLRQTELLLDAGVMRAVKEMQQSEEYRGETWLPTGAIERFEHAIVDIGIETDGDVRSVTVTASLGTASTDGLRPHAGQTRRTRSFKVPLTTSQPSSTE